MKKILFLFFLLSISFGCFAQKKGKQRSDRKIIEISKIVNLDKRQESAIRGAYDVYMQIVDSALYKEPDAISAEQMKYSANKQFHTTLMNTLTERQRLQYIQVTSTPEIEAKAQYKMELLQESGEYSDA